MALGCSAVVCTLRLITKLPHTHPKTGVTKKYWAVEQEEEGEDGWGDEIKLLAQGRETRQSRVGSWLGPLMMPEKWWLVDD